MMEKNIYEALNDMTIDLSELKREDFTALEKRRAMKKFKASINKRPSYKKCAGVAIALAISAGTLGSAPVFAGTNPIMHSIASFLGIEKDLESYETVVNKEITKGDATIRLNEVILDEKELIVSTTITSKEPLQEMGADTLASVYVNGKRVSWAGSGASEQVDDYTVEEVMHYALEDTYTGEMDMTLIFDGVRINEVKQRGRWKFDFRTNGDELARNTVSKSIEQTFTLPNNVEITFTRYTANDMGEKIYFTQSERGATYDLALRGTDNKGNPVTFNLSNTKGKEGMMRRSTIDMDKVINTDEDIESYTLTLYAVKFPEESGKLSDDFEKVGEAFNIKLN